MTLAEVDQGAEPARKRWLREICAREEHFEAWMEHPTSSLLHHDRPCCDQARLWFLAYARSMEISALSQYRIKAPTWLSKLFEWGPSEWPIAWCQVIGAKTIDCGVFAALAREAFAAQGLEAHPAQALFSYNPDCTAHWKDLWRAYGKTMQKSWVHRRRGEVFPWIGDEAVYHEICVLELPDGSARLYDSTWGHWITPQERVGFGALLAVRSECPRLLSWEGRTLACGEWIG